ncbi:MAG: tetratricopeptide repeat protein, partial [candidate division NC10 bacterium]
MARGDQEGAARLYSEAVREAPGDVSLWYALGAALHRLRRWREAAEAFEYVMGHGRPDSREVRLARLWLERGRIGRETAPAEELLGQAARVEPGPEPPEAEGQDAPEELDAEPSEPSLAQQAAMLEAQGEYRKAAKLYYQGLQASPQDVSLWYALGTTLHRMDRSKAAARAFEKVVQHGQPDSREVELARLWLEGRDVPAESTVPDVGAEPEQQDHAGAPSASAEPDAEPSVASAISEPPAHSSSARQAALLAAQGDYEGAARLYYQAFEQALGAAPDDVLLWYALGVTLQHLSQGKAAAQAFEKVVQHGRPGSREVRLARLWLEIG